MLILVVHLECGNIEDVDGGEADGEHKPGYVEKDADHSGYQLGFHFPFKAVK